ncbi:MAG: hypothetical protein HOW97_07610 [Catenulispora sp.]|nr:hypothetical protein [Catenulispora sp.]
MTESPTGQGTSDYEIETTPAQAGPAGTAQTLPAQKTQSTPRSSSTEVIETVETADGIQEFQVKRLVPLPDEVPERPRNPFRRMATRITSEFRDPSPGLILSLAYIVLAIGLNWQLLLHPKTQLLGGNPYDQQYFEWQLTWVQHAVLHLHNPLFSHAMNAPDGMNVVGNPQIIGPAFVLTPITYLLGSSVSFALLTTWNLAATAITWRWFLRRHVVRSETAAFIGGLFLGFSPSMMTHSLAHPNLSGQWLVPLILSRLVRLRERETTVRDGVVLGLLIAAQVFVGEELLFLTALACFFFLIAYAAMRPRQTRAEGPTFLKGAAVAIATAAVVLAYPLTFQFAGPQSFKGIPFDISFYASDLKSYAVYPSLELWGDPDKVDKLAPNATEQAAMVGWALLLVVALLTVWCCLRNAAARALLIAGAAMMLLSLGPTPKFDGKPITWWWFPFGTEGIWSHLKDLPAFSSSLPMRSAMAVSWIIGILLAMGLDKAMEHQWYWLRGAAVGAAVVALVPLLPRVLDVTDRPKIPPYFTSGAWKGCVSKGHNTIASVPLSGSGDRTNMTWSIAADTGFGIPQGPVMAPTSPTDKQVVFGRVDVLWTAQWMSYIFQNGGASTPPVDAGIRSRVAQDLATWQANCVVAADGTAHLDALKAFLDRAIAPGVHTQGVTVWKEPSAH